MSFPKTLVVSLAMGISCLSSVVSAQSQQMRDMPQGQASDASFQATEHHYLSVRKILRDLNGGRNKSAESVERCARQIDQLPTVFVDHDMQEYSAAVSDKLWQIASVDRGMRIQKGAIEKQLEPQIARLGPGGVYYGRPYGASILGWDSNTRYQPRISGATMRRAATSQLVAETSELKAQLFSQLEVMDRDIRRITARNFGRELETNFVKSRRYGGDATLAAR